MYGAWYSALGWIPCSKAVASTNGFQEEPGWRPSPPPLIIPPDQHEALTWTAAPFVGGVHPPRAKLSRPSGPCPHWRLPTMASTKPVCGCTAARAISRGYDVPDIVERTAA